MSEGAQAWEGNAGAWVRWARSPGLDHAFWRMNWPAMREMLPSPGRLTIDVGCGEGRVSRELKRLGHVVVGVDPSSAMAAAALEVDPDIPVHVVSGARMPFAMGEADLVVASMMLMNVDDLDGVVREIGRVLEPGGTLCMSIVHPFNSGRDTGYFDGHRSVERVGDGGRTVVLDDVHRPLSAYFGALERGGMFVESLREPIPGAPYVQSYPQVKRWRDRPAFLLLRALRYDG